MVYYYMLHQISNFEVKIAEISEFEFVTVIAIVDLVVHMTRMARQKYLEGSLR